MKKTDDKSLQIKLEYEISEILMKHCEHWMRTAGPQAAGCVVAGPNLAAGGTSAVSTPEVYAETKCVK